MGGSAPQHEHYEEMKDTPWISQAREIANIGGEGVLNNYNKVNVFDDETKAELADRNEQIYNRAFNDASRYYTDTMNKYNASNYNQFGTLNATAPSYIVDRYQRDFQRQLNDMAYNKAINYDDLMDKELVRRYNTLNMYNSMYDYGETPYQLDLSNWNIRNTNKDVDYNNAVANYNTRRGFSPIGMLSGIGQGVIAGSSAGPIGMIGGGLAGGLTGGILGGRM